MRTWGRIKNPDSDKLEWVKVETAPDGTSDAVWLTTLCQSILLNINESPFFAELGIPQQQSVANQIPPEYYAMEIQNAYSAYFASLAILRTRPIDEVDSPTYKVNVVLKSGKTPLMKNIPK